MKKTFIYTACIAFFGFFSLTTFAQNVAVIDTQAAILQTQVAQDAFKALEEESEYASMVEDAKELQAARQNETVQAVATQLNPAMMQIINDLIVAKKIQLLLGADKALYFDGSVSITQQVTDALDGAAVAESETD